MIKHLIYFAFFYFRYYRRNRDVKKDKELQAFVNELSAKGTGPDGGNGQVNRPIAIFSRKTFRIKNTLRILTFKGS